MGVWIETVSPLTEGVAVRSRPTWACGLKPEAETPENGAQGHAPHGRVD